MNNKELKELLAGYPDDMPIRFRTGNDMEVLELDEENILHTSETAHVNEDAPEDDWDCEDGKVELGSGQQYILFNPIII